jgi:DNA-binding transcriptional ArsR family regulator
MNAKELKLMVQNANTASEGLKSLAHPTRLLAVCYISEGEKTVGELEVFLGMSQSNVSQHLGKLRDRDLLITRKEGNQVFYRLKDKNVLNLIKSLQDLYCR